MCVCVCVCVCVYSITCIYIYLPHLLYTLSVNGHLGSFHTLAIVDSAAINMGVHVSLRNSTPVSRSEERRVGKECRL